MCESVCEKLSKIGKSVENLLKSEKLKINNFNKLCYLRRLGISGVVPENPRVRSSTLRLGTKKMKGLRHID